MSKAKPTKHRETGKHREAFEAWYEAGRSFRKISKNFSQTERMLYLWAEWFDWHERADRRDEEIARENERRTIEQRAKIMDDHRKAGGLMRIKSTEFLLENGIKTEAGAVAAMRVGVEMERQAINLPDIYVKIANATSIEELEKLERELAIRRSQRPGNRSADEIGGGAQAGVITLPH